MSDDRKVTTFEVDATVIPRQARRAYPFGIGPLDEQLAEQVGDPVWTDLDETDREALVSLVTVALDRLREDPREWLPAAAVAQSHNRIGIFILWECGLLHSEALRLQARAQADEEASVTELLHLAQGD